MITLIEMKKKVDAYLFSLKPINRADILKENFGITHNMLKGEFEDFVNSLHLDQIITIYCLINNCDEEDLVINDEDPENITVCFNLSVLLNKPTKIN